MAALQGIEFWATLCDTEIEIRKQIQVYILLI